MIWRRKKASLRTDAQLHVARLRLQQHVEHFLLLCREVDRLTAIRQEIRNGQWGDQSEALKTLEEIQQVGAELIERIARVRDIRLRAIAQTQNPELAKRLEYKPPQP